MANGDIGKIKLDLGTKLRNVKKEFAAEFLDRLRDKTPVRTGALQDGWGQTQKAEGIEIWNVEPYAAFVNNGTAYQRPQRMVERTIAESDIIMEIAVQKAGLKK